MVIAASLAGKTRCVGGGPAGLYFALLMKLHEPGSDITVFERTAADSAYGWGVTCDDDLLAMFHRSDPYSAQGIEQAALRLENEVVDVQGKQVLRAGGCYTISRQRLLDILDGRTRDLGVHIKFGQEVTALSQLPEVDLAVACDGVNSRTRPEAGGFQAALRRPQTDACFSAQWFENLSRYIDLKPHEFSTLLHGRRSPLLPRLPPRRYYQLDHLTEQLTILILRALRRQAIPRVKTLCSRPNTMGTIDRSTIHLRAEVN
jgi:2-polyprenyl-6-methoxyphenol hydroxylase-like FAD-dependent oxidoreductase